MQQAARGDKRLRWHGCQPPGQCHGPGHAVLTLTLARYIPDHSPFFGVFCAQFVAEHGRAHRSRKPQPLDQKPGAARIRDQADLAESLDEGGCWRRNGDVTGHGQGCSRSRSHTIDRRNGGHAQLLEAPYRGVKGLIDNWTGIGAFHQIRTRRKVKFAQISPGAKPASCTGDDQRANGRIGFGLIQRAP